MRRRDALILAGGAWLPWPSGGRAQNPAPPLVGILSSISEPTLGFNDGMREAGFVEGHNLALQSRFAEGRYDLLPTMAAELIALRPKVIYAGALPAAVVLKEATSSIPIVFVVGADPVKQGLVASLAHPGGNLTGVTQYYGALGGKRLELLLELVPSVTTVAVLSNPHNPNAHNHLDEVQAAGRALGKHVLVIDASREAEIEAAFLGLDRLGASAMLVADDPLFRVRRVRIVALADRYAVPVIYFGRDFVAAGGLISYGSNARDNGRLAGLYVGRVLKGARPADLPVLQPTAFELVVNLKTAKALGLTVPPLILARADEVIE